MKYRSAGGRRDINPFCTDIITVCSVQRFLRDFGFSTWDIFRHFLYGIDAVLFRKQKSLIASNSKTVCLTAFMIIFHKYYLCY